MKRKPLITITLILGLGFGVLPAAMAGDSGYSQAPAKNVCTQKSSYQEKAPTRCERRCARLVQMLRKRGCICPSALYANQPARANTYLSSHYPPFRYSR